MIKRLLPIVLVVAAFLLDTAILPQFTSFWLLPVLSLLLVHCLGLLLGRTRGVLFGMIVGLAIDISVGTPLGLMTAICALLGYAGGWFGRLMWTNRLCPVISAAVCFLLYELVMDVYVVLSAAQFDSALLVRSLCRWLVYVLCTWGLHAGLKRVLKPGNPYYTR